MYHTREHLDSMSSEALRNLAFDALVRAFDSEEAVEGIINSDNIIFDGLDDYQRKQVALSFLCYLIIDKRERMAR